MTDEPIDLPRVAAARRRLLLIAERHPELLTNPNPNNREAWERVLAELEDDDVGRPKGPEPTRSLALRLPESLIDAVDAYVEHLADSLPSGVTITRADAFRVLISEGLKQAGIEPKKGKRKK